MRIHTTFLAALPAASLLVTSPALADDDAVEEIVVTAHPLSAEGIAQASLILEGAELDRALDATLGATLASQPGIHAGSYGAASGRPVVHGLAGPRIRIMEDRIDTLDASVTSADHAVTIEPFLADRIEIIKGASTLLYGSGAIGGVIDVHTGRIPHVPAGAPLGVRGEVRVDDNADRTFGALRANGDAGALSWHVDAFYRDANIYEIPDFAESAALRAQEAAEGDEEGGEEEEEVRGALPGSDLRNEGGAVGLSWIGDFGFVGASLSVLDSRYGIPGGHGHGHEEEEGEEHGEEEEEEEGNATIDLEQTRFDLEAGLRRPLPGFELANLRIGVNDYEHVEIEPSGEPGTVFTNEAVDTRLELVHDPLFEFVGTIGAQYTVREFAAIGEEAFVPPVDSDAYGLFWVGERDFGTFDLETGVRLERTDYSPSTGPDTDFTTFAASVGFVVDIAEATRLGLHTDLSTRAPVAEELYSNGPHLATNTFEVGDPALDRERALNLSATLTHRGDGFRAMATLYAIDFSDFIYQADTGVEEDELPVFAYRQDDARFYGLDVEAGWTLHRAGDRTLELTALFDTVDATVDVSGNDRLPRIPTTRLGLGLNFSDARLRAGIEILRGLEQDDIAEFELPTDAYTDLRVDLSYRMAVGDGFVETFVYGRNLLDDEIRDHTSFIKDLVPEPGRRLEAGLRIAF
ncbi:MAG: TonB-dependent receptor [Pseudomonadota bacterium]